MSCQGSRVHSPDIGRDPLATTFLFHRLSTREMTPAALRNLSGTVGRRYRPAVLLRPKTTDDEAACVALMRETHEQDGYPRYWPSRPERFLSPRQETRAWVAEVNGAVVGHVALHEATDHPTIPAAQRATGLLAERFAVVARLMVSPAVQGRGVGRTLLAAAVDGAREQDRRLVLDVVKESTAAIAMYESAGWTRLEPLTLDLNSAASEPIDLPPLQMWVYLASADGTRPSRVRTPDE